MLILNNSETRRLNNLESQFIMGKQNPFKKSTNAQHKQTRWVQNVIT